MFAITLPKKQIPSSLILIPMSLICAMSVFSADIIPMPTVCNPAKDCFELNERTRITYSESAETSAKLIQRELRRSTGYDLPSEIRSSTTSKIQSSLIWTRVWFSLDQRATCFRSQKKILPSRQATRPDSFMAFRRYVN